VCLLWECCVGEGVVLVCGLSTRRKLLIVIIFLKALRKSERRVCVRFVNTYSCAAERLRSMQLTSAQSTVQDYTT
jgi:sulfite exporter TauE/SafE